MTPQERTTGVLAADGLFILTATLFFYVGHQFGIQRNGETLPFPGTLLKHAFYEHEWQRPLLAAHHLF